MVCLNCGGKQGALPGHFIFPLFKLADDAAFVGLTTKGDEKDLGLSPEALGKGCSLTKLQPKPGSW